MGEPFGEHVMSNGGPSSCGGARMQDTHPILA